MKWIHIAAAMAAVFLSGCAAQEPVANNKAGMNADEPNIEKIPKVTTTNEGLSGNTIYQSAIRMSQESRRLLKEWDGSDKMLGEARTLIATCVLSQKEQIGNIAVPVIKKVISTSREKAEPWLTSILERKIKKVEGEEKKKWQQILAEVKGKA